VRVFLATPIRGVRTHEHIYRLMYDRLIALGVEVEGAFGLFPQDEVGLDEHGIYTRDIATLERSDMLVAEVSTPSLGVGFEIAHAVHLKVPVVCVHQKGTRVSAMVAGCPDVQLYAYATDEELCTIFEQLTRL